MDGDFKVFGLEAVGEDYARFRLFRQIHVKDRVAAIAVKMPVLAHIGAEPGGAAVELHLAHEAAADERIEAVIDRGHGDVRHAPFGADEDLLGGGMVALLQQHVIDVLALWCKTQAARAQPFGEAAFRLFATGILHTPSIMRPAGRVNI